MKHTKGEWMLPHLSDKKAECDCGFILSEHYMGAIAKIYWSKDRSIEHGDNPPLEEAIANGELIIEAASIANKTGYTPKQLAEQKAELLKALINFTENFPHTLAAIQANKAIKKATS